jgi:hypothetical protein
MSELQVHVASTQALQSAAAGKSLRGGQNVAGCKRAGQEDD